MFNTVEMVNGSVRLIDQTRLPTEEVYVDCHDYIAVGRAIKDMIVRGAPAIGVTAALGVVLGSEAIETGNKDEYTSKFLEVCSYMASTRPTAVNLFWAIERMKKVLESDVSGSVRQIKECVKKEASAILEEDKVINKKMGYVGAELFKLNDTILTHCNAGALATSGGYGTALGVIKAAQEQGKKLTVFVDETRPFLQGSRLTAWELVKEKIPVRLITDNMAGYFMKKGEVDKIIVGADRIAANGDTANKIGTYSLSILAKEHKIPFYIAAPLSTIDRNMKSGESIPIETRNSEEVTEIKGIRIAPYGIKVENPAFDVTPHENISAIITEKGIVYPPFNTGIEKLFFHVSSPLAD